MISNAMSIIQGHLAVMRSVTGMDEANIFTFQNHWVGDPQNLQASIEGRHGSPEEHAWRCRRGVH